MLSNTAACRSPRRVAFLLPSHKARLQKKNLRAGIKFLSKCLLRRHIDNRAHRQPRRGERCRFDRHVGIAMAAVSPPLLEVEDIAGTGDNLAKPKSSILACPRSVTKMFAGLMSRCVIPFVCAASNASAI